MSYRVPPRGVPLTDAQRDLAAKHWGWAISCSKSWIRDYPWIEEEIHTASLIGLIDAARTFDESRKLKFSTLLAVCVNYRCSHALKASRCQFRQTIRTEYRDFYDEFVDLTSEEPFEGETVRALLDSVPFPESEMLRRHLMGESMREIGVRFGVSRDVARQRIHATLNRMKDHPAAIGALQ